MEQFVKMKDITDDDIIKPLGKLSLDQLYNVRGFVYESRSLRI